MKLRYLLFRKKSGIYFIEDRQTKKQESLRTRNRIAAHRIFNAKNEAYLQPAVNMQIARAYLSASDPLVVQRTWQHAMEEVVRTKHGPTQEPQSSHSPSGDPKTHVDDAQADQCRLDIVHSFRHKVLPRGERVSIEQARPESC